MYLSYLLRWPYIGHKSVLSNSLSIFSNIFPLKIYILSFQNAQAFASNLIFRILVNFNVRGKTGIYSPNCAIFTQKCLHYAHNKIRQNLENHVRNKRLGILERQNISL